MEISFGGGRGYDKGIKACRYDKGIKAFKMKLHALSTSKHFSTTFDNFRTSFIKYL